MIYPEELQHLVGGPNGQLGIRNPLPGWLAAAWADFDTTTMVGVNPIWNDRNGTAARDLDVQVGTATNLTILPSGVALLTGTAGDKITAPDRAAYRSTGDNSLIFRLAANDFTPSADQIIIVCGDISTTATTNWAVTLDTTGAIIYSRPTGATARDFTSSAAPTVSNNQFIYIKINFDVDDGGGNSESSFSTSTDGISFTPLGVAQQIANTGAGNSDTAGLTIGSGNDDTLPFAGKISDLTVFSDVAATTQVADFDPSQAQVNVSTFSSGGDTYTLAGDAFVNATKFQGIYSSGGAGLETTAGQLVNSPLVIFDVFKPTLSAPAGNQFIYDARSDANARMVVFSDNSISDRYRVFQGGSAIDLGQPYDNNLRVFTGEFNGGATTKLTVSDVGSVTGDAGPDNYDHGSVFTSTSGADSMQGLYLERAIFELPLPAPAATIAAALQAKYS